MRGQIKEERDRLLSEDEQLKTAYTDLTVAETELREQQAKEDQKKNAAWKTILDNLSEENYRIEEAWQDLTEQEAIVDKKLACGNFATDQEKMECENDKDQLLQTRGLLKDEEERVAAAQQKEMERVETEMERWTQQKENELSALERKRDDLLRQQSKEIHSLFTQADTKLSEIQAQQEKCYDVDRLLNSLDDDVRRQISDLQEEVTKLSKAKDKQGQERKCAQEEKRETEADIESRLKEVQEQSDKEIGRIQEERCRWVVVHTLVSL